MPRLAGLSMALRSPWFASEQIDPVNVQIRGQFFLRRCALVAAEVLGDAPIDETHRLHNLDKLRLRQSTANSGGPEVDVTSGIEGQFSVNHHVRQQ